MSLKLFLRAQITEIRIGHLNSIKSEKLFFLKLRTESMIVCKYVIYVMYQTHTTCFKWLSARYKTRFLTAMKVTYLNH
jgi:hypothetical protein